MLCKHKSQAFNLLSAQLNARLTEMAGHGAENMDSQHIGRGIHRVCRAGRNKRPKLAIAAQFPAYANATRQNRTLPFAIFQRLASKCVIYQQNLLHLCCMSIFAKPLDPSGEIRFNTHLEGQLAQLVEQRIENPRVRGSIPRLATRRNPACLHAGFCLSDRLKQSCPQGGMLRACRCTPARHPQ